MDETQRMLELLDDGFPDVASMSPQAARTAVDARVRPTENLDDVEAALDELVPSPAGVVPVRVYRPHGGARAMPATVYAHGGGFVHGSIASHDAFLRRWARATGSTVISVEYRLAPEHLAPAPVEDVVAVVDWVAGTGLAPRGVVLAGDSAGGNLAAAASLVLREHGSTAVRGQVLIYPCLDPSMSSESYRTRGGRFITERTMRFYWQTYVGDRPLEAVDDWRIAPLIAPDHAGLPPAIVITAGLDALGDEGRAYADRLAAAGTPVIGRHYPDQFHGFLTIPDFGPGIAAQGVLWSDFDRMYGPEVSP